MEEGRDKNNDNNNNNNNNNSNNPDAGAVVAVEAASRRPLEVSLAASDESEADFDPKVQEFLRNMFAQGRASNINMASFFNQSGDPQRTLAKIQALQAQRSGLLHQLAGLDLQIEHQMEKLQQQLGAGKLDNTIKNVGKGFGKK